MSMNDQTQVGSRGKRRRLLTVLGFIGAYVIGLFALPPAIMVTSSAPLATAFNVAYAPLIARLQDVPMVGNAWNGYMRFLCRKMDYSCSPFEPAAEHDQWQE